MQNGFSVLWIPSLGGMQGMRRVVATAGGIASQHAILLAGERDHGGSWTLLYLPFVKSTTGQ